MCWFCSCIFLKWLQSIARSTFTHFAHAQCNGYIGLSLFSFKLQTGNLCMSAVSVCVMYASMAFISNLFHFFMVLFSALSLSLYRIFNARKHTLTHRSFQWLTNCFYLVATCRLFALTCSLTLTFIRMIWIEQCNRVQSIYFQYFWGRWIKCESVQRFLHTGKCNKSNIDSDNNLLAWTANHLNTQHNQPASVEVSYSFYFLPPKRKLIEGRKVFINMYKLVLFTGINKKKAWHRNIR